MSKRKERESVDKNNQKRRTRESMSVVGQKNKKKIYGRNMAEPERGVTDISSLIGFSRFSLFDALSGVCSIPLDLA